MSRQEDITQCLDRRILHDVMAHFVNLALVTISTTSKFGC